uniref:hypothetical protein n=1 Tax=Enterococcus faecalis TaxID=1351 RepID=UPI00155DC7BB|nr:hypothetical protein [Enterococcus faecalis]
MMTMCPRCLELYSEIWSKPCCKCADKTIPVDIELINVVQMLLTRGFDVSYATCYPDKEQGEIEAMEIEIHFRELYPQALFDGLPPDWIVIDEYPVLGGKVLDEPVDILTCAIEYRFEESIHIQKDIAISNLETWLEEKDPQSCRPILTLAGF